MPDTIPGAAAGIMSTIASPRWWDVVEAFALALFAHGLAARIDEVASRRVSDVVRELDLIGQPLFNPLDACIDDRAECFRLTRSKEALAQTQVLSRRRVQAR